MAKKKNKTATEKMKELLAEQEQIHAGYDKAVEQAQAEYIKLEKEFQEIDAEVRETHKNYVLNIVTHDTYLAEKKRLKDADETLRDAGFKLDEINRYRTEDLRELLTHMEEIAADYGKEKDTSQKVLKYKALQAKYDYLQAIHELAKEHSTVWNVSRQMEDLKVDLGLKQYNHLSYETVYNSLISNPFNSQLGMNITDSELRQAFYKGTVDKSLHDTIEQGKKAGFIQ
jgi:hypothetical protein